MNIAFYAPLKSPNHPVPSGDRAMARGLMSALRDPLNAAQNSTFQAGTSSSPNTVKLVSELRIYDPEGSRTTQSALRAKAQTEVSRLIELGRTAGWSAWVSYHNYYKAPDLIGPRVSKALNIPYVLVEATRARKRLNGPWAEFAQSAEDACDAADALFFLTERDAEAVHSFAPQGQRLVHLRPFLDRPDLPPMSTHTNQMLSVGMMRPGDKLASYQLIADTLDHLPKQSWVLNIIGDGDARGQVEQMMRPFGDSVRFWGALEPAAVNSHYAQARLLFWPGVNEAFGLTYLEAQAAGVPVVTQDRPGVRDVTQGTYPAVRQGTVAMAEDIIALTHDAPYHLERAQKARAFVKENHLRSGATRTLLDTLRTLAKDRS